MSGGLCIESRRSCPDIIHQTRPVPWRMWPVLHAPTPAQRERFLLQTHVQHGAQQLRRHERRLHRVEGKRHRLQS